jgi:hypothetical protein
MVLPQLVAELCPQCGADVRTSGTRCNGCGFYLPATPAPRTGPPMARPLPLKDGSKRTMVLVLVAGGSLVLSLLTVGATIALREPDPAPVARPAVLPTAATADTQPVALERSKLFADARREASAWHADAVLVSMSVSRVDARGVAPGASVEFDYARPSGARFTGGADTGLERLVLSSSGQSLVKREERAGKARVAPEPNCLFEEAWGAAQRAGAVTDGSLSMRYLWSDKHARPVWEVQVATGEVLRCSILTR